MIKSWWKRWVWHATQMGEKKNAYRIFVGKLKANRPLGKPRCKWVNNIKMDLREIGWGGMDWIHLAQDRD
jgi:hypothetical protein